VVTGLHERASLWCPVGLIFLVALKKVEFDDACVAAIFDYVGKKHCARTHIGKIRIMSDLIIKETIVILKAI
jgi:hypothetical protein